MDDYPLNRVPSFERFVADRRLFFELFGQPAQGSLVFCGSRECGAVRNYLAAWAGYCGDDAISWYGFGAKHSAPRAGDKFAACLQRKTRTHEQYDVATGPEAWDLLLSRFGELLEVDDGREVVIVAMSLLSTGLQPLLHDAAEGVARCSVCQDRRSGVVPGFRHVGELPAAEREDVVDAQDAVALDGPNLHDQDHPLSAGGFSPKPLPCSMTHK